MTTPDYTAQVQRGAAFLDEHGPMNWWARINADELDLADCHECVLGQLFGNFDDGAEILKLGKGLGVYYETSKLGFCVDFSEDYAKLSFNERDECWEALTTEWARVIKARQDAVEHDEKADTTPDWTGECQVCGASPIVPATGMCGPCTFGEADTANGNW